LQGAHYQPALPALAADWREIEGRLRGDWGETLAPPPVEHGGSSGDDAAWRRPRRPLVDGTAVGARCWPQDTRGTADRIGWAGRVRPRGVSAATTLCPRGGLLVVAVQYANPFGRPAPTGQPAPAAAGGTLRPVPSGTSLQEVDHRHTTRPRAGARSPRHAPAGTKATRYARPSPP
jgi:hypothetical protein